MRYIVTGSAGFIGFHLSHRLLELGHSVVGIDNLNNYYDVKLKEDRNAILNEYSNYTFNKIDVVDISGLKNVFKNTNPDIVIHLAAQAGVRYSIENPHSYAHSNLIGFLNILECCRQHPVLHLVYASSSSVYGSNAKIPFSEDDKADYPVSFYGATKKANEVMAHSYSHLYNIPCTGLRFFTVYGPWGRPDMAYFSFVKDILQGNTIKIFNHGRMKRDFTYIDDIIEGIISVCRLLPNDRQLVDGLSRVYNIGNSQPVVLEDFISAIERALGRKAVREYLPMQPGDMEATYADVSALMRDTGYRPNSPLEFGINNFITWYCSYYRNKISGT
ncbi:NAD-dependent epimerase [Sporomusaceae bacterium FL31]|nr:NAD-dependent epimerase [Sporomusaceae bacterium FL31]GCE33903.1 NAD-dependent epimerase [Sporomusaceae bacterium]